MFKLCVASASALLVLFWRFVWLEPRTAMVLQQGWGLWMILGVTAAWGVVVVKQLLLSASRWRDLARRHGLACFVLLAGASWLHLHEPHQFKVLQDEPTHVATSMLMFEQGETGTPGGLHLVDGEAHYPNVVPSIRMYLFPALLAMMHAVAGYRVENVFWLNGALGFALIFLVYVIGAIFAGRRGGLLAALLFLGMPLLAQNVTSAGYDVLNLVLILAFFLSLKRYTEKPGNEGIDLMLLTGILLAYCRYESILYLGLAVVAAGWKWSKEGRVSLTWFAVFSPLALWPCFTANAIMMSNDAFTLASLREEGTGFFDLRFWGKNTAEAIFYAFDFDRTSTNSLLLSAAGLLAVLVFWTGVLGRAVKRRPLTENTGRVWLALFIFFAAAIYAFVLTNFWGMPTQSSATRFILPLMMMLALAVPLAWKEIRPEAPVPRLGVGIAASFALLISGGINSQAYQTRNMMFPQAYAWLLEKAEVRGVRGETLYVAPSSLYLSMNKFPCIPTEALRQRLERAELSLEAGLYREVLVLDIRWQDPLSGRWGRKITEALPKGAQLEVLETKDLPRNYQARLLKLSPRPRKEEDPVNGVERPPIRTEFASAVERAIYRHSLLP